MSIGLAVSGIADKSCEGSYDIPHFVTTQFRDTNELCNDTIYVEAFDRFNRAANGTIAINYSQKNQGGIVFKVRDYCDNIVYPENFVEYLSGLAKFYTSEPASPLAEYCKTIAKK